MNVFYLIIHSLQRLFKSRFQHRQGANQQTSFLSNIKVIYQYLFKCFINEFKWDLPLLLLSALLLVGFNSTVVHAQTSPVLNTAPTVTDASGAFGTLGTLKPNSIPARVGWPR